jgi:2-polyprenyl-3-methyl-5-hydroxy-6-metoxy-1,4-benzoquinol methylase
MPDLPDPALTWNKLAQLYHDKFFNLNIYNDSYDTFCDSVKTNNASILEIGCGPGNITHYLLTQRPDFNILGIDYAPDMIRIAKQNNPSANFMVMDCRNIRELKTRFDGIICGFCIPYLTPAETEDLISNCTSLLNQNGLLYISFVEGKLSESRLMTSSTGEKLFFNFYQSDYLIQLLTQSGYTDLQMIKVPYQRSANEQEEHSILMATKK